MVNLATPRDVSALEQEDEQLLDEQHNYELCLLCACLSLATKQCFLLRLSFCSFKDDCHEAIVELALSLFVAPPLGAPTATIVFYSQFMPSMMTWLEIIFYL
jgi:hypothetical protein